MTVSERIPLVVVTILGAVGTVNKDKRIREIEREISIGRGGRQTDRQGEREGKRNS